MLQAFRPGGNPPRAQGIMGARRMPWHRKSTKGAASRDRPGGGANGLRSRDSRMGEPSRRHGRLPDWRPSFRGTTGGTETSKYPEEEKSTEIARVAASESARAQTCDGAKAGAVASQVLRDAEPGPPGPGRSYKTTFERNGMGRPAAAGESPVREGRGLRSAIQSRAGHVKPGPKQGGPPSKAEHSPMTDSEPVPRGKGEKHPERGVKQRLKPCAPKQREPFRRR